jgi:hypothetical protein
MIEYHSEYQKLLTFFVEILKSYHSLVLFFRIMIRNSACPITGKLLSDCGRASKSGGNHAATLISSGSFTDFIILNVGYFFLNSLPQSLFNTLVWLSFLKGFYFFKLMKNSFAPHFLMHSSFLLILLTSSYFCSENCSRSTCWCYQKAWF